ncbi:MAG: undecaprenyl-diphosphate phosphatase [Bacteriovoracaceae bacterium]
MSFFHLFAYGLIQGIAEFLPISSSAHLALLPYFLKIEDPGVTFDLMMHIGTALAVIIYFRHDLILYLKELKVAFSLKQNINAKASFTRHLMIATCATFTIALLLKSAGEDWGRKPIFIICNLVFFGIYMWIGDRQSDGTEKVLEGKLELKKSLLIGISQGIAVFPGVSRSGATIGTGRFLGLGREEASRFSFLLSLPVIVAGAIVKLPEVLRGGHSFQPMDCLLGIAFSFLFGFATIYVFMKLIKKIGLGYFTLYRFLLGAVLAYYFYF